MRFCGVPLYIAGVTRHRTDIQVRFGDSDALGHINNASIASYAEVGRLDFVQRAVGKAVGTIILASLHLDFRRQIDLRDRVHVETWISAVGRSSVTLAQVIYANDERAADVKSVIVYFDYATNQSREIPSDIREMLAPFVAK